MESKNVAANDDIKKVDSKNVVVDNQHQDQRSRDDVNKKSSANIYVMHATMTKASTIKEN